MPSIYEAYAIYSECTNDKLGTEEMKKNLANRVFNTEEAYYGDAIHKEEKGERIKLAPGVYRVSGLSFLTMLSAGVPPVPPVDVTLLKDVYPGYCILYDANNPPTLEDMTGVLCVGTMGTAYDGTPSFFDCVLEVNDKHLEISLGHQCSYDKPPEPPSKEPYLKVYLRLGGSDYHVCARIAIFKIA